MERGVRRIMVDISQWHPSPGRFELLLFLLPSHQHSSITGFVKLEDRKRALVSRLLQNYVVNDVLGIPWDEIVIGRTELGKPYLESGGRRIDLPNFNFNTSHHGDFVGIASEPLCLVGLDIVLCDRPNQETVVEFLRSFTSYFAPLEWDVIINAGTPAQMLENFYRYWSLKEAYTKAIGAGLGFVLNKLEFRHANWSDICVWIEGKESKHWEFQFSELGKGHLAAVARGPASGVDLKDKQQFKGSHLSNPDFTFCCIEQLVIAANPEFRDKFTET